MTCTRVHGELLMVNSFNNVFIDLEFRIERINFAWKKRKSWTIDIKLFNIKI